ncbi:MAG: IPT/TIG domain-containing protein [Cytophagales bacterium]|nr:IPT/TIG domain-containing protein [Cytophagales bacterium]
MDCLATGTANLVSAGFDDAFIISKLWMPTGNYLWAKGHGGTINDESRGLTLDVGVGNVYAVRNLNPYSGLQSWSGNIRSHFIRDIVTALLYKRNSFAVVIYIEREAFEGAGGAIPGHQELMWMSIGWIYTTGYFGGTVDFDTGTGVSNVTAAGSNDSFIHKMRQASPPPTITSFAPTMGPVGTTVIIDGTNFSGTTANNIVYFVPHKSNGYSSHAHTTYSVPLGATYRRDFQF